MHCLDGSFEAAGEKCFWWLKVGQVSRRSQVLLLPLGGAGNALHSGKYRRNPVLSSVPPPPPPCPGTALRKNHPLVPRSNSRTTFFYHGIGCFMVLVDAGQLFRCAGQHCVAMGPPIRGDPISQSQAHIPLKPLPPALDPCPEATSP